MKSRIGRWLRRLFRPEPEGEERWTDHPKAMQEKVAQERVAQREGLIDPPTVTCDEPNFMDAATRIVYAFDRRSVALMGDRVRVDNREGVRHGDVRGVDMFKLQGRFVRRLQIYLDPLKGEQ